MRWAFYDLKTGFFTGRHFSARGASHLKANTPGGCGAMEGEHDPRTERVDLSTGEIVSYEAPPDLSRERYRLHARIVALERAQARPVRELLIDPTNPEARRRLTAIEDEIAELRAALTSPAGLGAS